MTETKPGDKGRESTGYEQLSWQSKSNLAAGSVTVGVSTMESHDIGPVAFH